MVPRKAKVVAAATVLSLAQWALCGCAGGLGSGGGTGVNSPGETTNSSTFPGGVGVSPQLGATQGVALDSQGHVYVSSNRSLAAYDSQWRQIWNNSNALAGLPSAVSHLGDIDYSNGYLYGPVEAWAGCTGKYSPTVLAVYNASTGNLVTWSDISADGHEASSVAIDSADNEAVVTSFCPIDGFSTLWSYDLNSLIANPPGNSLAYTSTTTLSTPIQYIQGISWNADAKLFVISADNSGPAGSLWFASRSGVVTGPVYIVPTAVGTELEGVDYNSGYLTFLESGNVYGIGAPAAPPVFSLAPGTFCGTQAVNITDTTAGTAIYYTTNGAMPTTASTMYSGAVTVDSSETLSAIAAVSGSASSAMTTATYMIDPSSCTAAEPNQ